MRAHCEVDGIRSARSMPATRGLHLCACWQGQVSSEIGVYPAIDGMWKGPPQAFQTRKNRDRREIAERRIGEWVLQMLAKGSCIHAAAAYPLLIPAEYSCTQWTYMNVLCY